MSGLDLFLLAVISAGALRGWFAGATRKLVSLVGWLVGFTVAASLMGPVGVVLSAVLGISDRTAPVAGFIVLFVASLVGVALIGHAIRKALHAVRLGGLDRAAGAAVGGLEAALGLSVLLMITSMSPFPGAGPWLITEETRRESVLHDPVRAVAPVVWRLVRVAVPGVQSLLSDKFNAWDSTGAPAGEADGR